MGPTRQIPTRAASLVTADHGGRELLHSRGLRRCGGERGEGDRLFSLVSQPHAHRRSQPCRRPRRRHHHCRICCPRWGTRWRPWGRASRPAAAAAATTSGGGCPRSSSGRWRRRRRWGWGRPCTGRRRRLSASTMRRRQRTGSRPSRSASRAASTPTRRASEVRGINRCHGQVMDGSARPPFACGGAHRPGRGPPRRAGGSYVVERCWVRPSEGARRVEGPRWGRLRGTRLGRGPCGRRDPAARSGRHDLMGCGNGARGWARGGGGGPVGSWGIVRGLQEGSWGGRAAGGL